MVTRINDHQPVGVASAVLISRTEIDELQDFLTKLMEPKAQQVAVLSDAQFTELKTLLQPGFELSTAMLKDYRAQRGASMPGTPVGMPYAPMTDMELGDFNRSHGRPADDQTERLQRNYANQNQNRQTEPPPGGFATVAGPGTPINTADAARIKREQDDATARSEAQRKSADKTAAEAAANEKKRADAAYAAD